MTRTLRDYQADAVDAVRGEWAAGRTRTAAVMATGLGKSTVIGKLATDHARDGGRPLILAHRGELLSQLADACRAIAPDVPVGHVQASRNESRRPITVAMAPTLANERRRARTPRPSLVIVDECHHAVSPSYMSILRWAGVFAEDPDQRVPLLGVTATLTRGDRLGLGDVFQSVAFTRDTAWAIEHGWLTRPIGRVVVAEHMNLHAAKVSRGDFQDGELGEMVSQDTDQIVKAWREHAADRITVAFVPTVSSAHDLAAEFAAAGVPAEVVIGTTPTAARDGIYARLAAGLTRVMVGVGVPTEGWDCPPVSCVLMARPTKLKGLYAQMVGRGLRLHPGKDDALVLDVVGASRRMRLVTLVDLHPSAEINRDEVEALPCEACGGWVSGWVDVEGGGRPCSCPVEVDEGGGRDPDGGRTRLRGPARYADVDLLGLVDDGEAWNWLATAGGTPFLSAGKRWAVLWDEGGGQWSAGHTAGIGDPGAVALVEHVDLDAARTAAELWAADEGAGRRAAPWRVARKRPSEKQQRYAAGLGVPDPGGMTAGACSDAIDVVRASRRLDAV